MQRFMVAIIGIIFLVSGGFMYFRNQKLIKNCTMEAVATVVDMKQEFTTDNDTTGYIYYPIIEYKAGENTVKVTMDSSSNTPSYSINEKITILYNPNNVNEFRLKDDKMSNIISIVLVVVGIAVTGYGIKVAIKGN